MVGLTQPKRRAPTRILVMSHSHQLDVFGPHYSMIYSGSKLEKLVLTSVRKCNVRPKGSHFVLP